MIPQGTYLNEFEANGGCGRVGRAVKEAYRGELEQLVPKAEPLGMVALAVRGVGSILFERLALAPALAHGCTVLEERGGGAGGNYSRTESPKFGAMNAWHVHAHAHVQ